MKERRLDRRAFLGRLCSWLAACAGLAVTGILPRESPVERLKGHPARHYRKLAG